MSRRRMYATLLALVLCGVLVSLAACGGEGGSEEEAATHTVTPNTPTSTATPVSDTSSDTGTSAQLIQPADLVYLGAFRLPDGPEEIGWGYSGTAMAYYPDGDPDGPADGYPGSRNGQG